METVPIRGVARIPADFFGAGSDPFVGSIPLAGVPLGVTAQGDFGNSDTLISRSADPFDRCELLGPFPYGAPSVDIQILDLSLASTTSLTVTYDNGQDPEEWNVTVDLSAVHTDGVPENDPPLGYLDAIRTYCNGGTYTSLLYVLPRCTFIKVSDPGVTRILDTGLTGGYDPVPLNQIDPAPWVMDIDSDLGLTGDPCSDFHAGITDPVEIYNCDCNATGQRDICDIEDAASLDCNANQVPDECDLSEGTSSDNNANDVPDECDMGIPELPGAVEHQARKNRYISIDPNNDLIDVALRVELTSMKRCTGNPARACRDTSDCQNPTPGQGLCVEHAHVGSVLGWVQEPFQGCSPAHACDSTDWFTGIGPEPWYQD
ncbi:MAG: hypothetical protein JSU63_00360 [Phycisphaerales bacterium]|nr:MAG: hypothetical protein JSU63_00360 [Phycisphaerales bacterium]